MPWIDAADCTGPYATTARLVLAIDDVEIDLMVGFVIWPEGVAGPRDPVCIPSLPAGRWHGIRLGSLEAWLVAYRLMARPTKAGLIHGTWPRAASIANTWSVCSRSRCRRRSGGNWRISGMADSRHELEFGYFLDPGSRAGSDDPERMLAIPCSTEYGLPFFR